MPPTTELRPLPAIDVSGRRVSEVLREVNTAIEAAGIEFGEYGFSDMTAYSSVPDFPTNVRWVACFPVVGGSEGYYVHIEIIWQACDSDIEFNPRSREYARRLVGLAKTWTAESATEIANAAWRMLDPRFI